MKQCLVLLQSLSFPVSSAFDSLKKNFHWSIYGPPELVETPGFLASKLQFCDSVNNPSLSLFQMLSEALCAHRFFHSRSQVLCFSHGHQISCAEATFRAHTYNPRTAKPPSKNLSCKKERGVCTYISPEFKSSTSNGIWLNSNGSMIKDSYTHYNLGPFHICS